MGTRLIQQRRGKGSPTYRSPSHRYVGAICFPSVQDKRILGEIIDLINCPGHSSPLIYAEYEDGQAALIPAPLASKVGQIIEFGKNVKPEMGNIIELKDAPNGTEIYCIERTPGNGPKLVRASGGSAKVVDQVENKVIIQLPSKKKITLNSKCRAIVGLLSGGGRPEKPFVKAGNKMKAMRAKNKLYPRTHGVAMNAADHPFGATHRRGLGRPATVSRNAPPGRKVGLIAAKRAGRKKR